VFIIVVKGVKTKKTKPEAEEEIKFLSFMEEDTNLETEVFHEDCHNGKAEIHNYDRNEPTLICQRCGHRERINLSTDFRIAIIKTTIDGKERKISDNVKVVHRDYYGERCPTCNGTGRILPRVS